MPDKYETICFLLQITILEYIVRIGQLLCQLFLAIGSALSNLSLPIEPILRVVDLIIDFVEQRLAEIVFITDFFQ